MTQYEDVAPINEKHGIFLVRNSATKELCVKKVQKTYNISIYNRLKDLAIKGIPAIYSIDESDGELTVIEQYVPGETLEGMLKESGAMSEDKIRDISIKICAILIRLHEQNPPIIHRDIKPSNVIVTPEGEIYLLDLNAAKFEDSSKDEDTVLLGTYGYAAPEQYGFGTSTAQTDIYVLGMLMNTMLRGEYSKKIAGNSILSEIIEKCVMIRPEDRYGSAKELEAVLISPTKRKSISFMPPGFRTMNPLHMFIAVIGYMAIIAISLAIQSRYKDNSIATWYERVFCLIMMLSVVFLTADYGGIQGKLPLCRSQNVFIKILGIILFDAMLLLEPCLSW